MPHAACVSIEYARGQGDGCVLLAAAIGEGLRWRLEQGVLRFSHDGKPKLFMRGHGYAPEPFERGHGDTPRLFEHGHADKPKSFEHGHVDEPRPSEYGHGDELKPSEHGRVDAPRSFKRVMPINQSCRDSPDSTHSAPASVPNASPQSALRAALNSALSRFVTMRLFSPSRAHSSSVILPGSISGCRRTRA